MSEGNNVTLTGNLTRSVELRYTPAGLAIANFGLAVNQRKKNGNEWEDIPHFVDITAFDQLASNAADTIDKGSRVTITGRLNFSQWEDKNGGGKRSKLDVVADDIAVSLRFATAEVERNERGGSPAGGNAPASNDQEPF